RPDRRAGQQRRARRPDPVGRPDRGGVGPGHGHHAHSHLPGHPGRAALLRLGRAQRRDRQQRLRARLARPALAVALRRRQGRGDGPDPHQRHRGRRARRADQRGLAVDRQAPLPGQGLQRGTARPARRRRGLRPGGRGVGDRDRDRDAGQRLHHLHDRRDRLGLQPAGVTESAVRSEAARSERRAELLDIAAGLFAERGLRATTVRDIADAAGILSGSLYHHFDSKESMVDEILSGFLDELFAAYEQIVGSTADPQTKLDQMVRASFSAIDRSHAAVAIYQEEAKRLAEVPRFDYLARRNRQFRDLWVAVLERGVEQGVFRPGIDVELAYRFIRDTVWVAVRWYRPGGTRSAESVADQYLAIVLHGISADPASAPR